MCRVYYVVAVVVVLGTTFALVFLIRNPVPVDMPPLPANGDRITNGEDEPMRPTRGERNDELACLGEGEVAGYPKPAHLLDDSRYDLRVADRGVTISVRDAVTGEVLRTVHIPDNSSGGNSLWLLDCAIYVTTSNDPFYPKDYESDLWRYRYDGYGEFMLEKISQELVDSGADTYSSLFVDTQEQYLALVKSHSGRDDYAFVLKDPQSLEDVFEVTMNEIQAKLPGLLRGQLTHAGFSSDGSYFWGEVSGGPIRLAFYRLNLETGEVDVFEAPDGTLGGDDFNVDRGLTTYHKGKVPWTGIAEQMRETADRWMEEGRGLEFGFADVTTGEMTVIETTDDPNTFYRPIWISPTELEYVMPSGEVKTYTISGRD